MVRPEPPAGVLADQHRGDMDVVLGVPDRDPPRPTLIPRHGDPGAVQQLPRDPRPLPVRQDPVGGGDPRRAVPHIPPLALLGGARVGSPAATAGACNAVINGPSARSYSPGPVEAGCQAVSSPSQEAITRGARCTSAVPGPSR